MSPRTSCSASRSVETTAPGSPWSTASTCWPEPGNSNPIRAASLPLYGIPFGVKDSIDVAGWPTTLACPGYAYVAEQTAPVVQRLLDAGAILIGKTNLDQFVTGLNGTCTPHTIPRASSGRT